jgi:ppGpp synthetase/RelA/SpoT-type nucleotidyltranferase
MNYDEYVREGHFQYEAFARAVATILQTAIDDSREDFHLQQISSRAKSKISLHRKLNERGLSKLQTIETELKDLAGCRLVFYTNTDVDRFLNSQLIFENFKVDFDGSKFHHALGKDRKVEELYFAIHYLVSLTDERLALPEYRKFRGLRCEIQIQTILNHAWAETTHDILYHRPDLKGFGTKQFAAITERLTKIMNNYLLPAGYEFQAAQHDFERLRQGKELFDRNTVEALRTADNNNDRYEYLHRIKDDLLPYYDDVANMAPELIRSVLETIKKARAAPVKEIETALGNIPGHTAERVVNAALELIENLRYADIQETFRVLCELYVSAGTNEERRRIIQVTERLAHHDINVWRQAGFVVQKLLQESISALSDADRATVRPLVLTVAQQILDPEMTGSTSHFQSVSLHRGAVQPSETFGLVRSKVLDLLFRMYGEAKTDQEKGDIIHSLDRATRFPGIAGHGDEFTTMVLDNTHRIVEFFADRTDTEPFDLLQTLEHHYLWLYRRTKELAQTQMDDRKEIVDKAKAIVAAIERFRDRANSRQEFVRFKTLVGYESVFPSQWDGNAMDIEGPAAYRAARITEYAASVANDTADEWYDEIRRCASVQSNDGATFPNFCEFLKQVAARSPEIMLRYLEKGDDVLSGFLPAILEGLQQSEHSASLGLLERWVEEGRHLASIARHLRLTKGGSGKLIRRVGQKALDTKDLIATIEIIAAVVANSAVDLVDSIVVPGIRHFTTIGDTRWVHAIWFMPELQTFVRKKMSEAHCEVVLDNLTLCVRIDHDEESILQPIAVNFPRLVWRFLKKRLDRETGNNLDERYEAIPYELRELRKPLARSVDFAVDTVRSWYSSEDSLFQFRGGKVLHNVFPGFSPEVEAKLIGVVQEGTKEAIDFVLGILRAYQGEAFLHGVCKEIVNNLPEKDRRLDEIEIILESTGVVWGQFGRVEVYQRKKEEISSWLCDSRPKVIAFAEKYQRFLDRAVAAEQRRSEADYELRRREWADDE